MKRGRKRGKRLRILTPRKSTVMSPTNKVRAQALVRKSIYRINQFFHFFQNKIKNISFIVVQKLLKESNVIIIVSLSVLHLLINALKPDEAVHSSSTRIYFCLLTCLYSWMPSK